ncbi:molybdopterin molybdotransferase MoeA [Streptacidiphilus sp. P02-A3a]|uniref:molybdopterin molybdotransferase MoeA n=1 Tax=Streptacidiphilus sp. P02-A3a TaxID=2704468 RepID=UPI0015FD06DF|nr:molybdopterin molybdotransferase MoeA [Streptacidiphilus sp. P02-A3a]QMU73349.1 molybdopterin molybdotransferase MoeA [Streptacidiphilus sp. P02-A3a]
MSVGSASESDLLSAYPFLLRPAAAAPDPAAPGPGATGSPRDRPGDRPYDQAAPPPDAGTGPDAGPRPGPVPPEPSALTWPQARRRAQRAAGAPLPGVRLPLAEALGGVLAAPLEARTDLPAFDTSAMDGWAVSGPGPWQLTGELLAGQGGAPLLHDGTAVRIATGAQLPPGATAVLRREDGGVRPGNSGGELLHDRGAVPLDLGRDIRPRGQECHSGEPLLPPGTAVTPAVLGLAAAAGCDELPVHRRPTVELLVLGDELLDSGLPRDGRIRDALGPLLPSWLRGYGARIIAVRRVGDDLGLLRDALLRSPADVVVTTGGTAAGPVDFLHTALAEAGARLLVDGVLVRPGHPMLLAWLPAQDTDAASPADNADTRADSAAAPRRRWLIGLPGNPLAAVAGAVTLAEPLLRTLAGWPQPRPYLVRAAAPLPGHRTDTRLLPVVLSEQGAVPLAYDGPAMLRGLALAEGLAVVPPGGLPAGARVELLEVPTG